MASGIPVDEFHVRIWHEEPGRARTEVVAIGSYALSPQDAGAMVMACSSETISEALRIPSPITSVDLQAVATSTVVGAVHDLRGNPIAGAVVSPRPAGFRDDLLQWLSEVGLRSLDDAQSDANGNFELDQAWLGNWNIEAEAFGYGLGVEQVKVSPGVASRVLFELEPLDGVRVRLIGADRWPTGVLEVAETSFGTRVRCDPEGTAWLPLTHPTPGLDVSAFLPGDHQINAFWPDGIPNGAESVQIWLGGGPQLTVSVVGETTIEGPLILAAQGHHASGYELWVTSQLDPGASIALECFTEGPVWLSLNYEQDNQGVEILRDRTTLVDGKSTSVVLTVPDAPRVLRLVDADHEPVGGMETFLATPETAELSPAGGTTDDDGEVHVPVQRESSMSLSGLDPVSTTAFADIQFECDWNIAADHTVDLGKVASSNVELRDAFSGELLGDRIVYISSNQMSFALVEDSTLPNGDPAQFDWYSAGPPYIELPGDDIWSPRDLIRIQPGLNTLEVRLRTTLLLRGPGAADLELEHVETGSNLAALLSDSGVNRVVSGQEVRLSGVPSGTYRVRFGPEANWQGPHAAAPAGEVVIVRAE